MTTFLVVVGVVLGHLVLFVFLAALAGNEGVDPFEDIR